jgi:hypothetical protein
VFKITKSQLFPRHIIENHSEEEIAYMKRQLDSAMIGLARKKFNKKKKGFGYDDPDSKTNSSNS